MNDGEEDKERSGSQYKSVLSYLLQHIDKYKSKPTLGLFQDGSELLGERGG